MSSLSQVDRKWFDLHRRECQEAVNNLANLLTKAPKGAKLYALRRLWSLCRVFDEVSKPQNWSRHPTARPSSLNEKTVGDPLPSARRFGDELLSQRNASCWVEQSLADGKSGTVADGGSTLEVHNLCTMEEVGLSTETLADSVVPGGINSGWWNRNQFLYHNPLDGGTSTVPPVVEECGPYVRQTPVEYNIFHREQGHLPSEITWDVLHDALISTYRPMVGALPDHGGMTSAWSDPLLWWSSPTGAHHFCTIGGWSTGRWSECVLSLLLEGSHIFADQAVYHVHETGQGKLQDMITACQRIENQLAFQDVHDRVRFLSVRRVLGLVGVSQVHNAVVRLGGKLRPGLLNVDSLARTVRAAALASKEGNEVEVQLLSPVWDVNAVGVKQITLSHPPEIPNILESLSDRGKYPHVFAHAETVSLPPIALRRNTEVAQDDVAGSDSYNDVGRKLGLRSSINGDDSFYEEYLKLPLDLDSPNHFPCRSSDDGWNLIKDWGNRKIYSRVYAEETVTLDRMLALVRLWFDLVARQDCFEIHPRPHGWTGKGCLAIPLQTSFSSLVEIMGQYSLESHQEGLIRIDTALPVALASRDRRERWINWLVTCLLLCGPVSWEGQHACMGPVAERVSNKLKWDPMVDEAGGATRLRVTFDDGFSLPPELTQFQFDSMHGFLLSDGLAVFWRATRNEQRDADVSNLLWHVGENSVHLVNISLADKYERGLGQFGIKYGTPPDETSRSWVCSHISAYQQKMVANPNPRVGDVHIAVGAKTLSEIAKDAEDELRLEIEVHNGALRVKNKDGKLRNIWRSLTSMNASVLGVAFGFSKQHAERSNSLIVKTKTHLEEVLLAASKVIGDRVRGSQLTSGQVLGYGGAILMTAVFLGQLRVRGSCTGWVPADSRSSDQDAFYVADSLRLPSVTGRSIKVPNEGVEELEADLLLSQRHRVCLRGSVMHRTTASLDIGSGPFPCVWQISSSQGPVGIHTGDVQVAGFQSCDDDWLLE